MSKRPIPQEEYFIATLPDKVIFPLPLGECCVQIFTSDSDIAHFHVANMTYDIPINLYSPEYNKAPCNRLFHRFDDEEKKILQDFLNSIAWDPFGKKDTTVYQKLTNLWESENGDYSNYPEQENYYLLPMPNYLDL